MVYVYPPVPRTDGTRTCTIRSDDDAPFLIRTPTVYWDRKKETLSPLHEGGDAWLKRLQTLEMEVVTRVHEKRWDSFRHATLHALQKGFVSSVDPEGTRVRVAIVSNSSMAEGVSSEGGCIRGSLRMDRLILDPRNGYRVRWVLESPTSVSKSVPCLFEEDQVTLYDVEWNP